METWDIRTLDIEPHHPQVLRSDDQALRVIAINLPAGEVMQEHQTHERGYVIVLDGQIEIEHAGETVSGGPGLLAHFEPNERREVRAQADSRILLALAPWPGEGHHRRVASS